MKKERRRESAEWEMKLTSSKDKMIELVDQKLVLHDELEATLEMYN
jgi:hypothetical protein